MLFYFFYCSKHDGQNDLQYSGYLLCLGNRKKVFQRLLLAFAKLICSPVAGVITAVFPQRPCQQTGPGHDVVNNKTISQDLLLHIQGRAEMILL